MSWLKVIALPILKAAAPWVARKLFPAQAKEQEDTEAARHGAAAGAAAHRASKEVDRHGKQ